MSDEKRTMYNDYSRSKDALRRRISRLEENQNLLFPADILEGKSIEEMNELRGKELEEIGVEFTNQVLEGEVDDPEEIRTGKTRGNTAEDIEDILNDIDEFYKKRNINKYNEEKNNFSYADEIALEAFKNQFQTNHPEVLDLVNKFLHKAVSIYGINAVRNGLMNSAFNVEFARQAGYDPAETASYLAKVLKEIESEYELLTGESSDESEISQFLDNFVEAVENEEDWSSVY